MITPLLLIAMQAQPLPGDPMAFPEPIERPARETADTAAMPGPSARLRDCLQATLNDAPAALLSAREWRLEAEGFSAAEAYHCEGMALVKLDRLGEAQAAFLAARDLLGDNRLGYRARMSELAGMAALANKRPKEAFDLLGLSRGEKIASGISFADARLLLNQAQAAQAVGDSHTAEAILADLRERDATNIEVWLRSIEFARATNRVSEAERYIVQARRLQPGNLEIDLQEAALAQDKGDLEKAREILQNMANDDGFFGEVAKQFLSMLEDSQ